MKSIALALGLIALTLGCDAPLRSRGSVGASDRGRADEGLGEDGAAPGRDDAEPLDGASIDAASSDAGHGAEDVSLGREDAALNVDGALRFDAMPARDASASTDAEAAPDRAQPSDAGVMPSDAGDGLDGSGPINLDAGPPPDAGSNPDAGPPRDAGANPVPVCDTAWWWYFDPAATEVRVTGTMSTPPWHDQNAPLLSFGEGLFGAPADRFPPGQHRYKLIVDGDPLWRTDPWNPLRESDGVGGENNLVGLWHSFVFQPPPSAIEVRVAGSFTTPPWDVTQAPALSAAAPGSAWSVVSFALPAGRHSYKFVSRSSSGGAWTWREDPHNPEHEPDGVGGFNSVLHVCSSSP